MSVMYISQFSIQKYQLRPILHQLSLYPLLNALPHLCHCWVWQNKCSKRLGGWHSSQSYARKLGLGVCFFIANKANKMNTANSLHCKPISKQGILQKCKPKCKILNLKSLFALFALFACLFTLTKAQNNPKLYQSIYFYSCVSGLLFLVYLLSSQ